MNDETAFRPLTLKEARVFYREHLKYDFPADEVKPWMMIRRAWAGGRYFAYALFDGDGSPRAYAFFFGAEGTDTVLMDYFAVVRGRRGKGIGSMFLKKLRSALVPRRCGRILIEAEDPAHAADGADRALRERRVAFYLRAGARDTGLRYCLYGVDYVILALGGAGDASLLDGAAQDSMLLYRRMLGERRFEKHFRAGTP